MVKEKISKKDRRAPYWLSTMSAFSVMLVTLISGLAIVYDMQINNKVFNSIPNMLIGFFGIFLLLVASLFFQIVVHGIMKMKKHGINAKPPKQKIKQKTK